MLKRLLSNAVKTGTILTVTTSAAILAASANENNGAFGAINSVSHIVDGDERTYSDQFSPRDTVLGLALNSSAMYAWAAIYEVIFGRFDLPASIATASVFTVAAYLVDYHLVPPRFTPGIEKKLSKRAIFCMYAVIVLTLSISSRWKNK